MEKEEFIESSDSMKMAKENGKVKWIHEPSEVARFMMWK